MHRDSEVTMGSSISGRKQYYLDTVLYGILFLFFFQLMSDFVEAIYVFGLLGSGLPVETVCVLFLLSPVVLIPLRGGFSGKRLIFIGEAVLVSRVIEAMLDTRGKMIVAGIGVGCFMLFFPSLLRYLHNDRDEFDGLTLGSGLTVGLALSILFRALCSGTDISTHGWYQSIGWVLAAIAAVRLFGLSGQAHGTRQPGKQSSHVLRTTGLGLGVISVFVLVYFAFASPGVIARWTGADYRLVVSIALLALCLFVYLLTGRRLMAVLTLRTVVIWNVLFVLALAWTLLAHQIEFPPEAGAYPLPEPPVTPLHHVPLVLMLILFPIILVDFVLFTRELIAANPPSWVLGTSFTIASLFFLLMIFAQVFTTVYDYIPVVGPLFRDRFWFVFLFAGIVLTLPVLLLTTRAVDRKRLGEFRPGNALPGAILLTSLTTIGAIFLTASNPVAQPGPKTTLRILTYNIQQGYDESGIKNFDGQLDLIRGVDADVIGLQESDTARIAGGNSDVVRYFADRLDMYSYYGPKTVPGTFGIALLSKYPIEDPRTFYMYSIREQTATIEAQIAVGDRTFNIFVTHLGNGGPIVQQRQILESLQGKENIVLMGDFNFRPDTDQYSLTTEILDDSWLVEGARDAGIREIDPLQRIDHIFVSPGTAVVDSRYLVGPQSDHPAMTTEIEW
jgi:endonuclease/exonuclease/phosphatase family metal-dependent hydrolase